MVRNTLLALMIAVLLLGWLSGCYHANSLAEGRTHLRHAPDALTLMPEAASLFGDDYGAWWRDRNDYKPEAAAAYSAPVITRQRVVERTYDEQYSLGGRIRDRYRTRRDTYTESYQYGR